MDFVPVYSTSPDFLKAFKITSNILVVFKIWTHTEFLDHTPSRHDLNPCVYKPPTMHQGGLCDLKNTFQARINERAGGLRRQRRDFKQGREMVCFFEQSWPSDG